MTGKHSQIATLLLEVEKSLRDLALWSDVQPSPEALASTQPFAVDTLEFQEWLQFIFIPRMARLVEDGEQLPGNCGIAPMAEESFKQSSYQKNLLIKHLAEIDRILSL